MDAHVFALQVSDGGVPKLAVPSVEVTVDGLAGDRQRQRRFHGGPTRAVCLYALERIVALQREGHPVYPGAMGENVTVAGLDWSRVVPGARRALGAVTLVVDDYAVPCKTIAGAFLQGDSARVSQKKHPGWSRVYARVLVAGVVRVADPVTLEGPT
jgi:MOSC domain-containing protein YiiM